MREACPSYNEFEPNLLRKLPPLFDVTLAREGSVCVYVHGRVIEDPSMKHDEWSYDAAANETRIWFD